ncbi:MAG: hypothetical protein K2L45_08790, partial [Muribaculaceae bacterium]|nr:hypothetical protein [Muribaculaceae bacterium]
MKKYFLFMALAMSFMTAIAAGYQNDSIICHISGTVVDRPDSKYAILLEAGKDYRTSPCIPIPIVDGKFSYTLKDDMPRVYDLTFDDEYS